MAQPAVVTIAEFFLADQVELTKRPATHYLYPGGLFVHREPHAVTTVLGTCVAVCLWDRTLGVGGINHYMLPLWNGAGLASPKYGNIAVRKLIEQMEQMNCKRVNLVAKLFGGKTADSGDPSALNVGARNAQLAEELLYDACIPVIAKNLGGPFGRKLIFHTGTGEVLMRRIAGG